MGVESDFVKVWACVVPSGMDAPSYVSTTSTSLLVKWPEVRNVGGCPITGYSVYRDDGTSGSATIEVDAAKKTIPTLRSLAVPLSSSDSGKKFTFNLRVYNREGFTQSVDVTYLFATIPSKPSSAPTVTSYSSAHVQVSYLNPTANTGGSTILSLHLQYMRAYSGHWFDAVGLTPPSSLASQYYFNSSKIAKGIRYSFRYRVYNAIGWSDFSETSSVIASDVPSKPPAPTMATATSAAIKINL